MDDLPDGVRTLFLVLTGMDWPSAREELMLQSARAQNKLGHRLTEEIAPAVAQVTRATGDSVQGQAGEAFRASMAEFVAEPKNHLRSGTEFAHGYGDWTDKSAVEVEYMKLTAIATLAALVIELAIAAVKMAFPPTAPAGAAEAAAAQAIARVTLRLVLQRLFQQILRSVVSSTIFQVVMDTSVQLFQMAEGHRKSFDWNNTLRAVETGVISGAVTGAALPPLTSAARSFLPKAPGPGRSIGKGAIGWAGEGLGEYVGGGVAGLALDGEWSATGYDVTSGLAEGVAGSSGRAIGRKVRGGRGVGVGGSGGSGAGIGEGVPGHVEAPAEDPSGAGSDGVGSDVGAVGPAVDAAVPVPLDEADLPGGPGVTAGAASATGATVTSGSSGSSGPPGSLGSPGSTGVPGSTTSTGTTTPTNSTASPDPTSTTVDPAGTTASPPSDTTTMPTTSLTSPTTTTSPTSTTSTTSTDPTSVTMSTSPTPAPEHAPVPLTGTQVSQTHPLADHLAPRADVTTPGHHGSSAHLADVLDGVLGGPSGPSGRPGLPSVVATDCMPLLVSLHSRLFPPTTTLDTDVLTDSPAQVVEKLSGGRFTPVSSLSGLVDTVGAQASSTGQPRWIAVDAVVSGQRHAFLVQADGSGAVRLIDPQRARDAQRDGRPSQGSDLPPGVVDSGDPDFADLLGRAHDASAIVLGPDGHALAPQTAAPGTATGRGPGTPLSALTLAPLDLHAGGRTKGKGTDPGKGGGKDGKDSKDSKDGKPPASGKGKGRVTKPPAPRAGRASTAKAKDPTARTAVQLSSGERTMRDRIRATNTLGDRADVLTQAVARLSRLTFARGGWDERRPLAEDDTLGRIVRNGVAALAQLPPSAGPNDPQVRQFLTEHVVPLADRLADVLGLPPAPSAGTSPSGTTPSGTTPNPTATLPGTTPPARVGVPATVRHVSDVLGLLLGNDASSVHVKLAPLLLDAHGSAGTTGAWTRVPVQRPVASWASRRELQLAKHLSVVVHDFLTELKKDGAKGTKGGDGTAATPSGTQPDPPATQGSTATTGTTTGTTATTGTTTTTGTATTPLPAWTEVQVLHVNGHVVIATNNPDPVYLARAQGLLGGDVTLQGMLGHVSAQRTTDLARALRALDAARAEGRPPTSGLQGGSRRDRIRMMIKLAQVITATRALGTTAPQVHGLATTPIRSIDARSVGDQLDPGRPPGHLLPHGCRVRRPRRAASDGHVAAAAARAGHARVHRRPGDRRAAPALHVLRGHLSRGRDRVRPAGRPRLEPGRDLAQRRAVRTRTAGRARGDDQRPRPPRLARAAAVPRDPAARRQA